MTPGFSGPRGEGGGAGVTPATAQATPGQGAQNPQCARASSVAQENFEAITGFLSDRAGDIATISAVTGFGGGAVAAGAFSEGLAGLKAISQVSRGDTYGALKTIGNSVVGRLVGQLPRVLPIGGAAQKTFNAGVASVLGTGVTKGNDALVNCE